MILYVKEHCPYSRKVLKVVNALSAVVTVKTKGEDGVVDELVARGGKRQFPCLYDEDTKEALYESDAIVKRLCNRFGGDPERYRDEVGEVCPVCTDE